MTSMKKCIFYLRSAKAILYIFRFTRFIRKTGIDAIVFLKYLGALYLAKIPDNLILDNYKYNRVSYNKQSLFLSRNSSR